MSSLFRPSTPHDLERVQLFLQRAFGSPSGAAFIQPAMMQWKYWDHRGDWQEPRSYLLERGGVVTAFAGLWPMSFRNGSETIRGIHMIDWASAADAPGAGLVLVQKLSGIFDFILAIGGSAMTRKALPAFGFVEYAHQWHAAVPLRPLRQMLTHQSRNWKLVARLVRNTLYMTKPAKHDPGWHSAPIEPDQILPILYSTDAHASPRSPEFFYFLSKCPAASLVLHGIYDPGGLRGHFALTLVRGQARIAGVWLHNPDGPAWQAAYALARITAQQMKPACELVVTGTGDVSGASAAVAGFRVRQKTAPVYLLNKKGKLNLPSDFQFQLCDDDEAFLDTGSEVYST